LQQHHTHFRVGARMGQGLRQRGIHGQRQRIFALRATETEAQHPRHQLGMNLFTGAHKRIHKIAPFCKRGLSIGASRRPSVAPPPRRLQFPPFAQPTTRKPMNIRELLNQRVLAAMAACGVPAELPALVAPSKAAPGKNASFGDYQANCAMGAAKAMGTNPRELAGRIVAALDLNGIADKIEIAGPGFINIHLNNTWLGEQIAAAQTHARLAVAASSDAQTVVIDYSGPNHAKEMHVGHLRSTIIGDSLARLLEFLGHQVIRQNHVGDWGTQFGMLIAELEEQLGARGDAEMQLKDLEVFYQQAKKHFDDDAAFADKARDYVVRLQSGDENMLQLWQQFKNVSLQHSTEIYQMLIVTLRDEHVRGERFYNT